MSLVVGYGALLDPAHVEALCGRGVRVRPGFLSGFRRHWNLVYRNGCWSEGRFERVAPGEPRPGGIAYLGVREAADSVLPVLEIETDDAGLAILDEEEYLYRRIDVRECYERTGGPSPDEAVWLYRDVPEEHPEGAYDGPDVVVSRSYRDRVTAAAAMLLSEGARRFEETTDRPRWPIADLIWVPS